MQLHCCKESHLLMNACVNKSLFQVLKGLKQKMNSLDHCHPTCCSTSLVNWLSNVHTRIRRYKRKQDAILCRPHNYYVSASVPKWPQKLSQSISFLFQNFLWEHAPRSPNFACLCMHIHAYTPCRHLCNPPSENHNRSPTHWVWLLNFLVRL